jgi:hypothetical protein
MSIEERRKLAHPFAYAFPCFNFIDEKGNQRKVTAVIVAISYYQDELGRDRIGYACSLGENCGCTYCGYSFKSKK